MTIREPNAPITTRERNAIRAGLRALQAIHEAKDGYGRATLGYSDTMTLENIATCGGDHAALTVGEIDRLCDALANGEVL